MTTCPWCGAAESAWQPLPHEPRFGQLVWVCESHRRGTHDYQSRYCEGFTDAKDKLCEMTEKLKAWAPVVQVAVAHELIGCEIRVEPPSGTGCECRLCQAVRAIAPELRPEVRDE
jgi:hypothetical protein